MSLTELVAVSNSSATACMRGGSFPVDIFTKPADMETFEVRTAQRDQFVEITDRVQQAVQGAGITSGVVIVYVPHTTAGVTINENADPDVVHDMLLTLRKLIPKELPGYRHAEGNSDSHVKASMMGASAHILVEEGRLVLGTWQGVYFCEFDGPRNRTVHVQVMGNRSRK